ncbi:MAG: hypothetical protein CVU39_15685 [Chloroflexi bacterium HGW-Chloroflexi-10]|nr:MAG: hypothetical protein CVU39_15685 [Chloroflexi bacterium HGW-Chloroflexi-10]
MLILVLTACQLKTPVPVIPLEENRLIQLDDETSMPPLVLGVDPKPDEVIGPRQDFTFHFSQAMEPKSTEAAFRFSPLVSGRFEWLDEVTVSFFADQELGIGQNLTVEIQKSAQNQNGDLLGQSFRSNYRVAQPLRIGMKYPENGSSQIKPDIQSLFITFNQAVVDLSENQENLPIGFYLEPDVAGQGFWLNNSTYAFKPDSGLFSGIEYKAYINRQLRSLHGTVLEVSGDTDWVFSTIQPEIVSFSPLQEKTIPLDQTFNLKFNQAMVTESVASNFRISDVGGNPVVGRFVWNNEKTEMTFLPSELLKRGTIYLVELLAGSVVAGGGVLNQPFALSYTTIRDLKIMGVLPSVGTPLVYQQEQTEIKILFSNFLDENQTFSENVSIYPEVKKLVFALKDSNQTLSIKGDFSPGQKYRVWISSALQDQWGASLGETFEFDATVEPQQPALEIPGAEKNVLVTDSPIAELIIETVNIAEISLYVIPLSTEDFFNNQDVAIKDIPASVSPILFTSLKSSNQKEISSIPLQENIEPLPPGIFRILIETNNQVTYEYLLVNNFINPYINFDTSKLITWIPNIADNHPFEVEQTIYGVDSSGNTLFEGVISTTGWSVVEMPGQFSLEKVAWIGIGTPESGFFSMVQNLQQPVELIEKDTSNPDGIIKTDQAAYRPGDTVQFWTTFPSTLQGDLIESGPERVILYLRGMAPKEVEYVNIETELFFNHDDMINMGELNLPNHLPDGVYRLGIDGYSSVFNDIIISYTAGIDVVLEIDPGSENYVYGNPMQLRIISQDSPLMLPAGTPVHWAIWVDSPDLLAQEFITDPSTTATEIINGDGELNAVGEYSIEIPFSQYQEIVDISQLPLELTFTASIPVNDWLSFSTTKKIQMDPGRIGIEITGNPYYNQATDFIEFEVYSKRMNGTPIGSIPINIVFQKAIQNTEANEFEWVELNNSQITTNGDGFGKISIVPNGPGNYRIKCLVEGAIKVFPFWIGGQGLSSYQFLWNQPLPIVFDQTKYEIGDVVKLFVPNPFPSASTAIIYWQQGIDIEYMELDIPHDHLEIVLSNLVLSESVKIHAVLYNKEMDSILQGSAFIPLETFQENIAFSLEFNSNASDDTMTLTLSSNQETPKPIEFILNAFQTSTLEQSSVWNDTNGDLNETEILAVSAEFDEAENRVFMPVKLWNRYALWVKHVILDETGLAELVIPEQIIEQTDQIEYFTVIDEKVTAYELPQIPNRFSLDYRIVLPEIVSNGDEFFAGVELVNHLDYPQTINLVIEPDGLNLIGEKEKIITVGVNSRKKILWPLTAQQPGSSFVRFEIKNPGGEIRLMESEIEVLATEWQTTNVQTGITDKDETLVYLSSELIDSAISSTIQIVVFPELTTILRLGSENFIAGGPYTVEQSIWILIAQLQIYDLVRAHPETDSVYREKLENHIRSLITEITRYQNQKGDWGNGISPILDQNSTDYAVWGLLLADRSGFFVPESVIEKSIEAILLQLPQIDSINNEWQFDQLAFEYFLLLENGNSNLHPDIFLEQANQLTGFGNGFLALAFDRLQKGSSESRTVLRDVEKNLNSDGMGHQYFPAYENNPVRNSDIIQTAAVAYALSELDPANEDIPNLINFLVSRQSQPAQWPNIFETAWSLSAISAYLKGTGQYLDQSDFEVFLNENEILQGNKENEYFSFPLNSTIEISPNSLNVQELKIINHLESMNLYYFAAITNENSPDNMIPNARTFDIERYAILPESQSLDMDCWYGLCKSDLRITTDAQNPVGFLLKFSVEKDLNEVFIQESLPGGMKILNLSSFEPADSPYPMLEPIITKTEALFSRSQRNNQVTWYTPELPAGTYYLPYYLVPDLVGNFYFSPVEIWTRFQSKEVDHNRPYRLLIVNVE